MGVGLYRSGLDDGLTLQVYLRSILQMEEDLAKTPYSEDIAKWGRLSRALQAQPQLVSLFRGIKKTEIEDISKTEEAAEAADRAQAKAFQELGTVTEEIKEVKNRLLTLFSELRLRLPNTARDLEKAGEKTDAKAAREIDFSTRATPRAAPEEEEEGQDDPKEAQAEASDEEATEEEVANDRESRAQTAIANTASRSARFFLDHPNILAAIVARDMPTSLADDLNQEASALLRLRDKRVLAMVNWKRATRAEYRAVAEHIEARGIVEPTLTKLAAESEAINALVVEHLKRKSSRLKPDE
jgi:hypothetical protein